MTEHPADPTVPAVPVDTQALVATRRTLHGIAEQILAAHGRRSGGSIRLLVTAGGFETRPAGADVVSLVGRAVRRGDGPLVPLAGTLGDVAAALDLEFGMPDPPYRPVSPAAASDPVVVDDGALALLVQSWARGAQALRLLTGRHGTASEPALWPEHFDVGTDLDKVNYGVSPGDDFSAVPYAYVGPWTARTGEFWNAPFGAARPLADLPDVDALLHWFETGRGLAAA